MEPEDPNQKQPQEEGQEPAEGEETDEATEEDDEEEPALLYLKADDIVAMWDMAGDDEEKFRELFQLIVDIGEQQLEDSGGGVESQQPSQSQSGLSPAVQAGLGQGGTPQKPAAGSPITRDSPLGTTSYPAKPQPVIA
jgi:hypothetical protein